MTSASSTSRIRSSRNGSAEPGKVFDREIGLDAIADGYRAIDTREALEVLVRP
ncbi:hypothetical protein IU450_10620 [Nocardia abscessus]|nr:hypothetical protein [Nocardia abscessus]